MALRPLIVVLATLVTPPAVAASASPLPSADPASVGLSAERLDRLARHFEGEAARGYSAGYVLMVARNGRLAYARAIGQRDVEKKLPMTLDTRFRIASMTKPVTAVAVLMLYEEGRFLLDDPVSRYLPEFADSKVYTGVAADGSLKTEPARRPITIRDLLTHQSGLGYGPGFDRSTPLAKVYAGVNFAGPGTLAEKVQALGSLPLYFQPGEGWRYSYSFDVLGRLVEVVSGQSFPDFLRTRLFGPLGMRNTGFTIAAAERQLLATLYTHGGNATGIKRSDPPWLSDPTEPARTPSGGGGLISTAGDYLRFAQMLVNGGTLDGHQVLSPTSVALMTSNQVPIDALQKYFGADSVGLGYGLGVAVEVDARHAYHAACIGDFYWGGILDTHWIASPRTGLVGVLLHQLDPTGNQSPPRTDYEFKNLLFATLTAGPGSTPATCMALP
jgi:CubicO group peptidase (beta-lactamase class C family)